MCGRFALVSWSALVEHFTLETVADDARRSRYNIAPTQLVPYLSNQSPRQLTMAHWGLIPAWARDRSRAARMINARAETLAEKPSFKNPFRRRRCLIPADGFYEWHGTGRHKQAVLFRLRGHGLFAFAGLWERWRAPDGTTVHSVTIITTSANELVASVHDRMPVILPPTDYEHWLSAYDCPPDELSPLLRPYPATVMECLEVSPFVNKATNDSPACQEPVGCGSLF